MKIKQAATATGLTEKAIRLYEAHGLITPATTEIAGRQFREYDAATVERLKQISVFRRAGFSMEQIAALLAGQGSRVLPAYRAHLQQELAQKQRVLAALNGAGTPPADAAALAALLAPAVQTDPLPEPELSFDDSDARPALPPTGLWLWHGPLPWRLHGGALALALLLREQPMTWPALCAACKQRMPSLPPQKLARLLAKLKHRGVVAEQNGTYTVQGGPLDRFDAAYTTDQLMDFLAATQFTANGKMLYTATPPMSVSSQGPGSV